MNCPVCQAPDLSDDLSNCPHCGSDLDVLRMTRRIVRQSKNFKGLAIIASILFAAILIVWLLSLASGDKADETAASEDKPETSAMQADYSKAVQENETLKIEVAQLKKQLAEKEVEAKKRIKEYQVREGESLFGISRSVYGNGFRYVDLAADNEIDDPSRIYAGQKLIIYY